MTRTGTPTSVNIRPGVSVLGVLAHLEYKVWHALAEYVDNAVQSFRNNRGVLGAQGVTSVKVEIELDTANRRIEVRDNAAGIARTDFPRAFRPAETPPQKGGLCEFGMGMKSASCWFAPTWAVRTSALGDPVERRVAFDIEHIVHDKIEELDIEEASAPAEAHYTVVELLDCRTNPKGQTIAKIKRHLSDIYREFLRSGELQLIVGGTRLEYPEPVVLRAPRFTVNREPEGRAVEWRREIAPAVGADVDRGGRHQLGVRMSLGHPFMARLPKLDRGHVVRAATKGRE